MICKGLFFCVAVVMVFTGGAGGGSKKRLFQYAFEIAALAFIPAPLTAILLR
jgi:hypothetical protein